MKIKKSILLVDDHLVVIKGIELMVNANIQNISIYSTENYSQTLEFLKVVTVDVILLDININGEENINIMKEIKSIQPNVKILIFSSHNENHYGLRYIQNGADGYLNKFCSEDVIITAINEIFTYGFYYNDEIKERIKIKGKKRTLKNGFDSLSKREFEIAQLLINGYGNLEISNKLNIQMSTVSTYKNRIFDKLNVSNIVALSEYFKTGNT